MDTPTPDTPELDGMPDAMPKVTHKITGILQEGHEELDLEIGDEVQIKRFGITASSKIHLLSILEKENSDGDVVLAVTWKLA